MRIRSDAWGGLRIAPVSKRALVRNENELVATLLLIRRRRSNKKMTNLLHNLLRLDYVSCVLTILATILLGRKLWQGWVVAAVNSAVVCVIGMRTAQFGFVPANLLCIALYTSNLVTWRLRRSVPTTRTPRPLPNPPVAESGGNDFL